MNETLHHTLRPQHPPGRIDGPAAAALCPAEDTLDALVRAPARIALAASLGLLDRDVDEAVQNAVALARRLTNTPVSFLGVVGPEVDHYKAIEGADAPLLVQRTLAGRTFCHYTHALGRTLRIDDTRSAAPWRDVPTVRTLGVAAYLGVPVRHAGEVVGSLCVVDLEARDWSDRDVDVVEALAESLERELALRAALAMAHAESRRQAEVVVQRESLVANVLHDLATPMQVMQLALAVLRPSAEGAAVDRLARAIEMLRELVASLNQADASDPSPDDRHAPGPLLLDAVAADAARMFEPLAARDGMVLQQSLSSGARLPVRRGELLRLLSNLLNNALKFSRPGSTVTLVSRRDADSGWACVAVRDEGLGMRPEQVLRCTERGYSDGHGRGDSTGLGLAIALEIAQRHGGSLHVRSQLGVGTEVEVRWPPVD